MSEIKDAAVLILGEIDRLDAPEHTKFHFRRFATDVFYRHGVRGIHRLERIEFARKLRIEGASQQAIRERLMSKFGITKSSAYRDIEKSLNFPENE